MAGYDDLDGEHDDLGRIAARDVGAAMRLAESHPTVPLRILFTELQHASRTVPSTAAGRDDVIEQVVQARLIHLAAHDLEAPPAS